MQIVFDHINIINNQQEHSVFSSRSYAASVSAPSFKVFLFAKIHQQHDWTAKSQSLWLKLGLIMHGFWCQSAPDFDVY